jgi:hypothetical protein
LASLVAILVCAVPATAVSTLAGDHVHLFLALPAYASAIAAAPAGSGPIRFHWRARQLRKNAGLRPSGRTGVASRQRAVAIRSRRNFHEDGLASRRALLRARDRLCPVSVGRSFGGPEPADRCAPRGLGAPWSLNAAGRAWQAGGLMR